MIQPKDAQPGMLGAGHGLQRLTETLESLTKGQSAQQQRDSQLHTTLTTQTQALAHLTQGLRWQRWAVAGLAGLLLLLSALVGWQVSPPPEQAYAKALGAVDSVLVQQWGSLAKTTQEHLTTTYNRLGLVPPGQRK